MHKTTQKNQNRYIQINGIKTNENKKIIEQRLVPSEYIEWMIYNRIRMLRV